MINLLKEVKLYVSQNLQKFIIFDFAQFFHQYIFLHISHTLKNLRLYKRNKKKNSLSRIIIDYIVDVCTVMNYILCTYQQQWSVLK